MSNGPWTSRSELCSPTCTARQCRQSTSGCQPRDKAGKKHKKKKKALSKDKDAGDGSAGGGTQRVLRLNNERVFKKDGTPRPKDYILERLKAVEGRTVEEAVGTLQKDTRGAPRGTACRSGVGTEHASATDG